MSWLGGGVGSPSPSSGATAWQPRHTNQHTSQLPRTVIGPPRSACGEGLWVWVLYRPEGGRGVSGRNCIKYADRACRAGPVLLRLEALGQLAQRLALDLPDALPCQPEALANFLQSLRLFAIQPEAHAQHGRLALVHLLQLI